MVLTPPSRITVSQWADRYRVLSERTSNQPGQWKTSTTPYLKGIMDAFTDPNIEEIWFCKPTQVGGTEAIYNMLGYTISQDSSPALMVYPTLELATYASKNRLQPMIELSPALAPLYRPNQSTDLDLQFTETILTLSGANSPASLAHRPIRYLFLDEIDKYPPSSGKESDPIRLAMERTRTFVTNRKIVGLSTPTTRRGNIWRAWESADEQYEYYMPCPHCGAEQTFEFHQVKWPDETEAVDARDLAWYECPSCKGIITDLHKSLMIKAGRWRPVSGKEHPRSAAFRLNALYSPWVRFGDAAYEFLRSKDYPDLLHNFVNSWLAEPWEETAAKTDAELVLERQSGYEAGIVPDGAVLLTGGVDVQENKLYWTIRAWGEKLTSWNIAHGESLSFSDIERVMNAEYHDPHGQAYRVSLCAIDSGDQTEDVYEFCRLHADWAIPVKGANRIMYTRYQISKNVADQIGIPLVLVDTSGYKDMIATRLRRPNGIGSWMVYLGCDLDYASQVTAEEKVLVKSGSSDVYRWTPKTSRSQNHYLDCEVYAACAADLMHVRYIGEEQQETNQPAAVNEPIVPKPMTNANNWINIRGSWL